tara:strand:+ start:461 stop:790 length:330 start_codon:yes stop_codon:yes gene_type:complete
MQNIRLLAVVFMLLSAGSTTYAFSSNDFSLPVEKEVNSQLVEAQFEFSASYLTTYAENLNTRLSFPSNALLPAEDSRLLSKSRAYYSISRLLEPGLSLPDLIFPFHTFL